MTRLKFQGLVPYPPLDRLDDWGLSPEQQVGRRDEGIGAQRGFGMSSAASLAAAAAAEAKQHVMKNASDAAPAALRCCACEQLDGGS